MNAVLPLHQAFMPPIEAVMNSSDVSAPATGPHPVSLRAQDGTYLVAGLTWHVATGPEVPVLKTDAPLVLRLAGLRAEIDRSVANAQAGSLLMALATGLLHNNPRASGTWVFVANTAGDEAAPTFLLAIADLSPPDPDQVNARVADRVVPRAGPEGIFASPEDVLAAFRTHLLTTEVAGIATCWPAGPDANCACILQGLASVAPDTPRHDVSPHPNNLPIFTAPPRVPARALGLATAGAAVLFAGIFIIVPAIQSLFEELPPPPVAMIDMVVDEGAFAKICLAALDAWWPRSVGWEISDRGCALAAHLPATPVLPDPGRSDRLIEPMMIWAHFTAATDRNPVLARAAAEQIIETWPHEVRLDAKSLTLWHVESLPTIAAEPTRITEGRVAPTPGYTRNRLAEAWAEAPDAVIVSEIGFTVTSPAGVIASEVFDRSARVSGLEPVSFVQSASGRGTLDLAPVATRQVPASLLATNISEASQ